MDSESKLPRRFSLEDGMDIPWFVDVIEQAEDIFGAHTFSYVYGKPYKSSQFLCLLQVSKWCYNVAWSFVEYQDVHAHLLSSFLDKCNPLQLKHLLVDFGAPKKGTPEARVISKELGEPPFNADLIKRASNLETLELCMCDSTWTSVFSLLPSLTNLQNLTLEDCVLHEHLPDDLLTEVTPTLLKLKEFEFYPAAHGDEEYEELFNLAYEKLIRVVETCTQLEALAIVITPEEMYQDLLENLTKFTQLRHFHFPSVTSQEQVQSLSVLTNLETLSFWSEGHEIDEHLFTPLTTLQNLNDLQWVAYLDDVTPKSVLTPLSALKNLREFNFQGSGDYSLAHWGFGDLQQIHELELFTGEFSMAESDCLARLTNLTKLTLNCWVDDEDPKFLEVLGQITSLQKLSLCTVPLEALATSEAGALNNLTNLRKLQIPRSSFISFPLLSRYLETVNSSDPTILEIQELLPKSSLRLGTYEEGKPSFASSLLTTAFSLLRIASADKPKDPRTLEEILSDEEVKKRWGLFPLLRQLKKLEVYYAPSEEDKKLLKLFFPSLEVKVVDIEEVEMGEGGEGEEDIWGSAEDDALDDLEYSEEEIPSDEEL